MTADFLPPPAQIEWLLDSMAHLLKQRGVEPFLTFPLLEPTDRYFPDAWVPDARGVRTLARRLLSYAGLPKLDVHVEMYTNPNEELALDAGVGQSRQWRREGAAAWFAGIEGNTCYFGADTNQLAEPDAIVGVMSHEVAHAYRLFHELAQDHSREEEELTDLTTVYLGYGVLTVNNAYRYRASGGLEGQQAVTQYSHASSGYLSPQAMSFLLALQAVSRRLASGERRGIAALLETNQATYFKAALKVIEKDHLSDRLPLPSGGLQVHEQAVVIPFGEDEGDTEEERAALDEQEDDDTDGPFNQDQPVFLVRQRVANRGLRYLVGVTGFGLAIVLRLALGSSGEVTVGVLFAGLILALVMGRVWGRHILYCSDPRCAAPLTETSTACPRCGGRIMGVISHPNERLAAEEALSPSSKEGLRLVGHEGEGKEGGHGGE